jgi:small-conductance mechanosensitive channel
MEAFFKNIVDSLKNYYQLFVAAIPQILLALLVGIILWVLIARLKLVFRKRLKKRAHDPLLADFLANIINSVLVILGIVAVLAVIGLGGIVTTILAGAGISAFIIGFAFKDIGENFLAGIMLAFKRPFGIGDRVETNGINGKVIGLNLRETIIKTLDGKDVFIPNALIVKNPLINFTIDGFLRTNFSIGIDYEDDIAGAINIILETVKAHPDVLKDASHVSAVAVDELATSTINLGVYFWIETNNPDLSLRDVKNDLMTSVVTKLAAEGYYLPADIVEVKNYNKSTIKTIKD